MRGRAFGQDARVLDLRDRATDPAALAAAIGEGGAHADVACDSSAGREGDSLAGLDGDEIADAAATVAATLGPLEPTPAYDHLGLLAPGRDVGVRPTLAAVARSWGHRPSQAAAIAATERERTSLAPESAGLDAARAAVAETAPRVEPLRERVAARRGALVSAREGDGDVEAAASELREAARRLSAVETAHFAARERLEGAREAARAARDRRDRRLTLEDRLGNLERAARAELATAAAPVVARAIASLPGGTTLDPAGPSLDGRDIDLLAGAARVARLGAPVVLATDWFGPPATAASRLDAKVVRV